MKTFEERYTAWLDGKLTGPALTGFERELEDRDAAEADRGEFQKLQQLLRSQTPVLKNADFFNHQLLARIEADKAASRPAHAPALFSMPWFRIALAGVAALVVGWMLGNMMSPLRNPIARVNEPISGIASVISAQPLESGISATVLKDDQDDFMVVWLDGLDYLPASYELQ